MVYDLVSHIVFGTTYPIGASFIKAVQGKEIDIRFIHHVERKWLWYNLIQLVTVVPFAICNVDIGRNASTSPMPMLLEQCSLR